MKLAILSPGHSERHEMVQLLRYLTVRREVDLVIGLGASEQRMMEALASPWEGIDGGAATIAPQELLDTLLFESAEERLLAPPWPLRLRPCSSGYPISLDSFTICFDDQRLGEPEVIFINIGGERIRFRSAPPAFSFPARGSLSYVLFEVETEGLRVECASAKGEPLGGPWMMRRAPRSSGEDSPASAQ